MLGRMALWLGGRGFGVDREEHASAEKEKEVKKRLKRAQNCFQYAIVNNFFSSETKIFHEGARIAFNQVIAGFDTSSFGSITQCLS